RRRPPRRGATTRRRPRRRSLTLNEGPPPPRCRSRDRRHDAPRRFGDMGPLANPRPGAALAPAPPRPRLPREPNPAAVCVAEARAWLEKRREILRAVDDRLALGALAAFLRPFLVTAETDGDVVLSAEDGLLGDATLTEETGRHAESKHR